MARTVQTDTIRGTDEDGRVWTVQIFQEVEEFQTEGSPDVKEVVVQQFARAVLTEDVLKVDDRTFRSMRGDVITVDRPTRRAD